jgi:hypothetical protein
MKWNLFYNSESILQLGIFDCGLRAAFDLRFARMENETLEEAEPARERTETKVTTSDILTRRREVRDPFLSYSILFYLMSSDHTHSIYMCLLLSHACMHCNCRERAIKMHKCSAT